MLSLRHTRPRSARFALALLAGVVTGCQPGVVAPTSPHGAVGTTQVVPAGTTPLGADLGAVATGQVYFHNMANSPLSLQVNNGTAISIGASSVAQGTLATGRIARGSQGSQVGDTSSLAVSFPEFQSAPKTYTLTINRVEVPVMQDVHVFLFLNMAVTTTAGKDIATVLPAH